MVRIKDKMDRLIEEVDKLEVEPRYYWKYPKDTLVINPLDGSAHHDAIVEKDVPVKVGNEGTIVRFRGAAVYMNPAETETGIQIAMIQKEPDNPSRWIARSMTDLKIFRTNDKEKICAYMMALIVTRLEEEAVILCRQQLLDWKANPTGPCPWYLESHEKIYAFMKHSSSSGIRSKEGNRAARRAAAKNAKKKN